MTEEKKLSKDGRRLIAYAVYAAVCVAACIGAGAVYQAMRHEISKTFETARYAPVMYLAYAVLGVLWAAEHMVAGRMKKKHMLPVRVLLILVMTLLGFGWAVAMLLTGGAAPAWLYNAYAHGSMPVYALVAGWLTVSTVQLLLRREK